MKKINTIYALLLFVFILSMCSCGARKSNIEKSKEQTTSNTIIESTVTGNTDTNVKTTTTVKVDDKDETVTKKTTYEPLDNSKESSILEPDGTKTILNNTKKTIEETVKKNNTKTESNTASDETKKESVKEQKNTNEVILSKKENKSKAVDKKQYNPFNLVLFCLIGLLCLCCIYRFYKKLPLIPKI